MGIVTDKCLTPEAVLQDCYKLEHHTALNSRSVAMSQRITLGQFCSETAPLSSLEEVAWQNNLPIKLNGRQLFF